jgi:hypothetical protein
VSQRLEGEMGTRIEEEVARRLEAGIASEVERRLENAVSDRVVAILPDRVDEVLTLRLAEELPGRIAAEKAAWEAEAALAAEEAKREAAEAATKEREIAGAMVRETRETARRELGAQLSQSLRVLRVASDAKEWKEAVLDAVAPLAGLSALFLVTKDRFALEGARGVGELETNFELEFHEAAAFHNAVESKDLVVAMRGDGEVSPYVMSLRHDAAEAPAKCYVFPVPVEDRVAALLYVEPRFENGEEAAIELGAIETLVTAAGLALHALRASRAAQASSLVNIATAMHGEEGGGYGDLRFEPVGVGAVPGVPGGVAGAGLAATAPVLTEKSFNWDELSQEDRELHMRAQRFARTQVAEMRLYKDDAVKAGRRDGNIYLRLKEEIDSARERYQAQFLDGQTHMRDYLHAELVETLAIDNPQLMGPDYPGLLA